ncbi:ATP-binding protein [Chitinivibrio alkaliphilus]|uniref:DNA polymerase III subunit delta n=1 Tax=Chitinivibrio alkaliphilus ACht1 TaxID=1313304 RepID=U7D6U6_9BACT|nr:DNA polymerase III subunit [Chitinivibrio alkaliphilus]ERP30802.1 hypothetical protein CALK_2368 [Chitinivibrio alkaliphilus ACht1]
MIQWRSLVGHDTNKELLSHAAQDGLLAHAYLFSGDMGSGKLDCAIQVAQYILCEASSKPCGQCTACRGVISHTYTDFRYAFPVELPKKQDGGAGRGITPEGWELLNEAVCQRLRSPYDPIPHYERSLPVDWIREIRTTVERGAVSGSSVVILIEGIDVLSKESANALLKMLEEPPENTHFILLCRSPERVLPTIVSRCQHMRFGRIPRVRILEELEKNSAASAEEIGHALALGRGSLGAARAACTEEHMHRLESVGRFTRILLGYGQEDELEQARALEKFVEEDLCRSYTTAHQVVLLFLEEFRIHFLTALRKEPDYILHEHDEMKMLCEQITVDQARTVVAVVEQVLESLRKHSPVLLAVSELFFKISELVYEEYRC